MTQKALSITASSSGYVDCMPSETDIFVLFFPLMTFLAGVYLVYRGVKRGVSSKKLLSGQVKSADSPMLSPFSKKPCIYWRAVIDRFVDKPNDPWVHVASFEDRGSFSIGGKLVDRSAPIRFEPSVETVFKGRPADKGKGIVTDFLKLARRSNPRVLISDTAKHVGLTVAASELSHNDILEPSVIDAALALSPDENKRKSLRKEISKGVRIRELIIPEGAKVNIIGESLAEKKGSISGSDLTVTDYPEDSAKVLLKERAFTGVLVGGILIVVSLAIFAWLLYSFLSDAGLIS